MLQNPCVPIIAGMLHSSSQLPAGEADDNYTLLLTVMEPHGSRWNNDKSGCLRYNVHESHQILLLSTAQPPTWVKLR